MEAINPSVSLLIPCYNQAGHIRQVVEAALDQTHPPDEIVVVDDASTDESVEILRQIPVRLICHEVNRGPAIARNTALQAASGDIIVYIDADAYADQRMIEALLQAYRLPSQVSIGGVGGRAVDVNTQSVYDRWRTLHAKQDYGLAPRENVPYLFGLCMSFRREALVKIGGFDPFFPINAGEDLDLGYRLLKAGYRLRYTPDAFVYHQHSDTEEKLKRIQYNWYYWSYLAKKRTGFHPWTLYAGTLRRLFTDTLADLIIRRDPKLSQLDVQIFKIKLAAIRDAEKYIGGNVAIK
jgi:GT2 family glycosyltransferase